MLDLAMVSRMGGRSSTARMPAPLEGRSVPLGKSAALHEGHQAIDLLGNDQAAEPPDCWLALGQLRVPAAGQFRELRPGAADSPPAPHAAACRDRKGRRSICTAFEPSLTWGARSS